MDLTTASLGQFRETQKGIVTRNRLKSDITVPLLPTSLFAVLSEVGV